MPKNKILAIQFKYLGDAVFISPALIALKAQFPDSEIHVLVAQEVAPLFECSSLLTKVWALPRTRGKARLAESWPFVKALRHENFDRSVDFSGNDRGAILSFLVGAKIRLSSTEGKPSLLQRFAYTQTVSTTTLPASWVNRHLQMLTTAWQTALPMAPKMLISANHSLANIAQDILQGHTIICHLGTSQQKKEWPVQRWKELYQLAYNAGYKLAFSAGSNEREQNLLVELKRLEPEIFALPPLKDLALYLAILNQAKLIISGDTGPLHFASGLGVKVIGLFGTADSVIHAAPIYTTNELVMSMPCTCIGDLAQFTGCQSHNSCMCSIAAAHVFKKLKEQYPLNT